MEVVSGVGVLIEYFSHLLKIVIRVFHEWTF